TRAEADARAGNIANQAHEPPPPGIDDPPPWPGWPAGGALGNTHPAWRALWETLDDATCLADVARLAQTSAEPFAALENALAAPDAQPPQPVLQGVAQLRAQVAAGADAAQDLMDRHARLAERLRDIAMAMDFTFLYEPLRRLFSIGYNVAAERLDRGFYDLLVSEARLASFFTIGKGEVDHRHWFHLGRPLAHTAGKSALVSWGGTMFEYLMPSLFLRSYPETLLAESCRVAVERQIEYGRQRGVPWGISESAFAALDGGLNYQYQSFGVPGLGLKRGLAENLVVAPYATALALAVRPKESLANLRALANEGAAGTWGYYDAVDYTPERLAPKQRRNLVRCFFAHHQGMLLTAIANCLCENSVQRRFHREPMTRAAELLLQERVPITAPLVHPHGDEVAQAPMVRAADQPLSRRLSTPHTAIPRAHLLSNGQYTVMVTNAGGGYSSCREIQVTRWRPDTTCDPWGQFIYLRDLERGTLWSAAHQPVGRPADEYEVLFSVDKAEFRRRDGDLETQMEVAVSPDNNVEMRLVTIANHGDRARTIDVTSYAELVLGAAGADLAHPAFQKLFIETELVGRRNALLARRRPRAPGEPPQWALHVLAVEEHVAAGELQFETDRARFLGRGGNAAAPAACAPRASLAGSTGAVLDPIFALRRALRLAAGQAVRLAFCTGLANGRDEALDLADRYHDPRVVSQAFELAWAHAQVELRHLRLKAGDIHLFQRLGSLLLYPDDSKRLTPAESLAPDGQGPMVLWRYGISGDAPIVVARITDENQEGLVRDLLSAHESWRSKNFTVELVVLNEHPTSYVDAVQQALQRVVGESSAWGLLNKRGGIFILHAARMPETDRALLLLAAQVVLDGRLGSLAHQLELAPGPKPLPAALRPAADARSAAPAEKAAPANEAVGSRFPNSFGQTSDDGREFVIELAQHRWTPAPWSNVIANASFGCLVTEAGLGCTWAENSRENRLTPWSNDPVADPPSEAVYLRDEETGEFWTPTPLPIRSSSSYRIRHAAGTTTYEHSAHGIEARLSVSVAANDPVKLLRLSLRNGTSRVRTLSIVYGVEWVLGVAREQTRMYVATQVDESSGALLTTNFLSQEFAGRVAFLHVVGRPFSLTGDRREFLGRNGSWARPAALGRVDLSGRTGAGLDPFGAVQTTVDLAAADETEIVFLLGQAADRGDLARLMAEYDSPPKVATALERVHDAWDDFLGTIQVRTPSRTLDSLLNRWLPYQVLSCRFWGRTAFYQSGGAYGYRDQLQDAMALVYGRPDLARGHILLAASRQFEEGDVQHWWHPPGGRGIRTRFSDDLLWLPFVAAHYVQTTGDAGILDESAPYLHSPPLADEQQERYEQPEASPQSEPLYEHCLRAIGRASRFGRHGLPLMGCGDWNDGMNRVGAHGQGESVWVGWFLLSVLEQFAPLVTTRGDAKRAAEFRQLAARLRDAVEQEAWDGRWYRRAYFDDGTPLGSAANAECRIDSIAQSWG
ncbi:MAG TPA: glucoamylase family protein, partial [Pirellulales bacterium]|nr:glucoamylase family protein [Pirellulales bacterium]